jgi:hypothetical protein
VEETEENHRPVASYFLFIKCSQRLRDVTGKRGHAFEVDQKVVDKLLKRTEM